MARNPSQRTQCVEAWAPDPIGVAKMVTILRRFGADMAGATFPNPAGWGLSGSLERTNTELWASPQAFTGDDGAALSTWGTGAVTPTEYPNDAHAAGIVLPGPAGV